MESLPQGQKQKIESICCDKVVLGAGIVAESISWTSQDVYCASEGNNTYFREEEMQRTGTITEKQEQEGWRYGSIKSAQSGWSMGCIHVLELVDVGGGGVNISSLIMNLGVFLFPREPCMQPPPPKGLLQPPSLCPSLSLPPWKRERERQRERANCGEVWLPSICPNTAHFLSSRATELHKATGPRAPALARGQRLFLGEKNVIQRCWRRC